MVEAATGCKEAGNSIARFGGKVLGVAVGDFFSETSRLVFAAGERDFVSEEFVEELAVRLFRIQLPLAIFLPLHAGCLLAPSSGALFARR